MNKAGGHFKSYHYIYDYNELLMMFKFNYAQLPC